MSDTLLIYSCSGCSNVAQMANHIALELTRRGYGEMSCIAGVGGNVPSLVNKAKRANRILALDGCHLHCVKSCLANHDIVADYHVTLSEYGHRKTYHQEFDPEEAESALAKVLAATFVNLEHTG